MSTIEGYIFPGRSMARFASLWDFVFELGFMRFATPEYVLLFLSIMIFELFILSVLLQTRSGQRSLGRLRGNPQSVLLLTTSEHSWRAMVTGQCRILYLSFREAGSYDRCVLGSHASVLIRERIRN